MRLSPVFIGIISLGFVSTSYAAEPGTYRPGQPYTASNTGSADQCQRHCLGDAQCRGWNFIRPRQEMAGGICELNSVSVSPVPSPHSVSGAGVITRDPSRVIPTGSNTYTVGKPVTTSIATNTIRVGTPGPTMQRPAHTPSQVTPTRRKIVEPVPQSRISPAMASHRPVTPTPAQRPAAPKAPALGYQHSLDAQHPAYQRHPNAPQTQARQAPTSQHQHQYQAAPVTDPRARRLQDRLKQQQMASAAPSPVTQPTQPPARANVSQSGQQPLPPGYAPPTRTAPQPSAPHLMQPKIPPGISVAQAEQSLYGSLYDDVTAPRSLKPEDIPMDADAPIATVSSVPTKPVTVERLLAGAPEN